MVLRRPIPPQAVPTSAKGPGQGSFARLSAPREGDQSLWLTAPAARAAARNASPRSS
jgi:hypothetical protein